jgi:hypothetical protein
LLVRSADQRRETGDAGPVGDGVVAPGLGLGLLGRPLRQEAVAVDAQLRREVGQHLAAGHVLRLGVEGAL